MLACVLLLAVGVAQAQTKAEGGKGELELKLSATTTTLCLGASLDLGLEIKSASPKTVKIDRADLWRDFSYSSPPKDDGFKSHGGYASGCSHCRGNLTFLYPGDTHWAAHRFSLAGEFFRKAGKYRIETSLHSAKSNEVEFEIMDCGKTESEVGR